MYVTSWCFCRFVCHICIVLNYVVFLVYNFDSLQCPLATPLALLVFVYVVCLVVFCFVLFVLFCLALRCVTLLCFICFGFVWLWFVLVCFFIFDLQFVLFCRLLCIFFLGALFL